MKNLNFVAGMTFRKVHELYAIKNCQVLVKNLNFVAGMTSYQPRNLNILRSKVNGFELFPEKLGAHTIEEEMR